MPRTALFDHLSALLGDRFQTSDAVRAQFSRDESHLPPATPDAGLWSASALRIIQESS